MELVVIFSAFFIAAMVCLFVSQQIIIEHTSVIASIVAFISSLLIAHRVTVTGPYSPHLFFSVDALGVIIMLIVSVVGMATMAYSVQYLRDEVHKKIIDFTHIKLYYILLNLFLAAMFFAVFSSNPVFTWISIEATTLSTAFLISFYKKPAAIEAAWKYLIINSIGLLLGFFGTLALFHFTNRYGRHRLFNMEYITYTCESIRSDNRKNCLCFCCHWLWYKGRPCTDAYLASRCAQQSTGSHKRASLRSSP